MPWLSLLLLSHTPFPPDAVALYSSSTISTLPPGAMAPPSSNPILPSLQMPWLFTPPPPSPPLARSRQVLVPLWSSPKLVPVTDQTLGATFFFGSSRRPGAAMKEFDPERRDKKLLGCAADMTDCSNTDLNVAQESYQIGLQDHL